MPCRGHRSPTPHRIVPEAPILSQGCITPTPEYGDRDPSPRASWFEHLQARPIEVGRLHPDLGNGGGLSNLRKGHLDERRQSTVGKFQSKCLFSVDPGKSVVLIKAIDRRLTSPFVD